MAAPLFLLFRVSSSDDKAFAGISRARTSPRLHPLATFAPEHRHARAKVRRIRSKKHNNKKHNKEESV